ncbi:MAG: DUF4097 family beta strand repeat-containing protein [Bacteroidales bacterium]|nr:DUF4097 family beta strand repeat-containing protein [Bacteroidales bacterium]
MKTYKFTLTIFLLFSLSLGAIARTEVKKEYHEKFPTNENTHLAISNQYGEVIINNTTQDEMTIDVIVTVESSNEKKSQEILETINIELSKNANAISAITEIEGHFKWNNVQVDIDYTINMPSYVNTKLELRYGDVRIADIIGTFDAEVRYGNFSANVLRTNDGGHINSLRMAYCGQVSVKSFGKMNLDISYSDAKLGVGEALDLESKYSDIKLGDIAIVKVELGYSDLSLSSTLDASVEGRYSDMDFGVVNGSLVVDIKYGDVDVDRLGKNFELIKVDASYSDIDMVVENGANYKIDLSASYGDISFPRINVTGVDKEGTSQFIRGYVGHQESGNKILVESRYGDINVSGM